MENKYLSEFIDIPIAIKEIRKDREIQNRKNIKNGTFATVYPQGPEARLLRVKPAGDWMKQEYGKPAFRKLFGEFWLENEICILFADTNLGKSILAVQIANHIAQGTQMEPFGNQMEQQTPVLYIDFEMSAKQFESRYFHRDYGSFPFGSTFFRAEFNPEAVDEGSNNDSFNDYLNSSINMAISDTKARVLIIDNLTYMSGGNEISKNALALMKHLKAIRLKYNLSILVLAHTPKRNGARPITVNDLQGSKMLINFCDSAFAIGQSHTVRGGRYLKQIKQRNVQKCYDGENVCLCRIERDMNFLQFVFEGYSTEKLHLLSDKDADKTQLHEKAIKLKQQGLTYRQISEQLKVPLSRVHRLLN